MERARTKHKPINSAHEGYAVILEELDEFWDEVKKKREMRDKRPCMTSWCKSQRWHSGRLMSVLDTPNAGFRNAASGAPGLDGGVQ